MTEAWFSSELGPWFALLSLLALLTIVEKGAIKGTRRRAALSAYAACIAFGAALLAATLLAIVSHQPAHVVRSLGLSGVIVTFTFAGALLRLRRLCAEWDIKKTIAQDL